MKNITKEHKKELDSLNAKHLYKTKEINEKYRVLSLINFIDKKDMFIYDDDINIKNQKTENLKHIFKAFPPTNKTFDVSSLRNGGEIIKSTFRISLFSPNNRSIVEPYFSIKYVSDTKKVDIKLNFSENPKIINFVLLDKRLPNDTEYVYYEGIRRAEIKKMAIPMYVFKDKGFKSFHGGQKVLITPLKIAEIMDFLT